MDKHLKDKVALVTGGGSGIGRATALSFTKEGAKVVVSDIRREGGEETVGKIKGTGGEAIFLEADVSKADEVEGLIKRIVEIYNRLDCAYNNAGIPGMLATTADYQEEIWDRVINTNLKGVWLCMKYEIHQMLKQGSGSIVNTSSVSGLVGARNQVAYAASKHGVIGLTKTAALEYAQSGIRINAVCPAMIRTPLVELFRRNPEFESQMLAKYPMGRMGHPEEVAEAVVWLCSDAASFVTGHAMVIDGGRTAD